MKHFLTVLVILTFLSCEQKSEKNVATVNNAMELYNTFNEGDHLKPNFDKTAFDTLHAWEFGWAILEPLNIASNTNEEIFLSQRLSPGQKALYFFWYLDAEVTNGGFIQFYWNDY